MGAYVEAGGYEQGITWKSLDPDDWLVRVCGTNSVNFDSLCWDVKFVTRKGEQYGGEEVGENADPSDHILRAARFEFGANLGQEIIAVDCLGGRCVGCRLSRVGLVPTIQRELLAYLRGRMTDTVQLL